MKDAFLDRCLKGRVPLFGGTVLLKDELTLLRPEPKIQTSPVIRCVVSQLRPYPEENRDLGVCFIDTRDDLPGWSAA